MARKDHSFQFNARDIANAAAAEALYHEKRAAYWHEELELSSKIVESTMSAKLVRQAVTGGWLPQVVVDYGDQAAMSRMHLAAQKIQSHEKAAIEYRQHETTYETQWERMYELDAADLAYFHLGGQPRED